MEKIVEQDVEDILIGGAFLGSGGGGSIEQGLRISKEIFDTVDHIEMIRLSEVRGNTVVSAGMGSPAVSKKKKWMDENILAVEKLEEITGEKISHVIPLEIGAGNLSVPLHTAAKKGIPIIDGDGAGRAIPELDMTTYAIYNIPISPISLADAERNFAVLYIENPLVAERAARAITDVCGMSTGIALHLMQPQQVKKVSIPDTISLSKRVGETIRGAKKEKKDGVNEVTKIVNGIELNRGKVLEKVSETRGGFDFGRIVVEGREKQVIVNFKNENMIVWHGKKPIAMAPDSICWIDLEGTPLTNVDIEEGREVAIIGINAHKKMKASKAFIPFARVLREFGYTGRYLSISEL